ncbi:GCN5-like N-acetyltransferase [Candidatus Magnetoovum chiemensis]|nr:GCN5-like N-acetyltransferase [Candidatus Magnetoovum chiemensis]
MLPRPLNMLYENIRDFFICEDSTDHSEAIASEYKYELIGVSALHVMWEDLGEIKSLAVRADKQRKGIGAALVNSCINEAKQIGLKRVFALTYVPDFFLTLGFEKIDKQALPQKTWGDCINCSKFPECDEQAVILDLDHKSQAKDNITT